MAVLACLNGETMPADQARVSIWDRGFLFGDAVYEVFRVYRGRLWLEDEHLGRLKRSLAELDFPAHALERLMDRVRRLIVASEIGDGTVYIQITRGVAPRTHAFPDPPVPPTELIVVKPYDDEPTARLRETGVRAITHPDLRWRRRDIKTVNLLGNVLAMEQAKRAGAYEAILVDQDGFVTEATHTSLLWVAGGRVHGTPEGWEILPGTTRNRTLRLVESLGIPFEAVHSPLADVLAADEVILVGTTSEVISITTIDDRVIGSGRPGPMSRRLWDGYRALVERFLAG